MSQDLQLFLQALKEVSHGEDVDDLKCELELVKEQLLKLDKKNNEQQSILRKKDETIASMRREIIDYKKQTAEVTYQWKSSLGAQSRLLEQVRKLNDELKAKGTLIMSLERERRKLSGEATGFASSRSNESRTRGRRVNDSMTNEDASDGRRRSASVDRLTDRRKNLARQLLTANQSQAYIVSRKESTIETTEKLVLLQRMLLSKTKTLAEKEVTIEQLNSRMSLLETQLSRLGKARLMAQELTAARHKMSLLTNQLEEAKNQLNQSNVQIKKLQDKLKSVNGQ